MRWDGYQLHRWRGPVKCCLLPIIAHNYLASWCGWTIIGCSVRSDGCWSRNDESFVIWDWVICVNKCPCAVTNLHLVAIFANDDNQKSNLLPILYRLVFSVAMTLATSSSRFSVSSITVWPSIVVIYVASSYVILLFTIVWVLMVL